MWFLSFRASCSMRLMGKRGAKSSAVHGRSSFGCSGGGSGAGRSAWMLYQAPGSEPPTTRDAKRRAAAAEAAAVAEAAARTKAAMAKKAKPPRRQGERPVQVKKGKWLS